MMVVIILYAVGRAELVVSNEDCLRRVAIRGWALLWGIGERFG